MSEVDSYSRPIPDFLAQAFHAEAAQAVAARRQADTLEEDAVRRGRQTGLSWDRMGEVLAVPGETLRRRYKDMPISEGPAAKARRRAGLTWAQERRRAMGTAWDPEGAESPAQPPAAVGGAGPST